MHAVLGDRNYYWTRKVEDYVMTLPKARIITGGRPGVMKVAANAAKSHHIPVKTYKPQGTFENQNEWDIALMSLLLRNTSSAAIFTCFGDSGSLYAIRYCQRNEIPFRVYGKDGLPYHYKPGDVEPRK